MFPNGFAFHQFHSAGWIKALSFFHLDERWSLSGLLISEAVQINLQTWKERRIQLASHAERRRLKKEQRKRSGGREREREVRRR